MINTYSDYIFILKIFLIFDASIDFLPFLRHNPFMFCKQHGASHNKSFSHVCTPRPKTMNMMYVKRKGCRRDSSHISSLKRKEAVLEFLQNGGVFVIIVPYKRNNMAAIKKLL